MYSNENRVSQLLTCYCHGAVNRSTGVAMTARGQTLSSVCDFPCFWIEVSHDVCFACEERFGEQKTWVLWYLPVLFSRPPAIPQVSARPNSPGAIPSRRFSPPCHSRTPTHACMSLHFQDISPSQHSHYLFRPTQSSWKKMIPRALVMWCQSHPTIDIGASLPFF